MRAPPERRQSSFSVRDNLPCQPAYWYQCVFVLLAMAGFISVEGYIRLMNGLRQTVRRVRQSSIDDGAESRDRSMSGDAPARGVSI